jgi:chromosome condensin MukBEF ATPase and DNA-binding subunit MukB
VQGQAKDREVSKVSEMLLSTQDELDTARKEVAACKAQLARKGLVADRQRAMQQQQHAAECAALQALHDDTKLQLKEQHEQLQAVTARERKLVENVKRLQQQVKAEQAEAARWERRAFARKGQRLVAERVLDLCLQSQASQDAA